jgi:hypothetical protein
LVWLGPEKDKSDLAMVLFEEMSQYTLNGGIKGALLQKLGRWIYLQGRKTESLGMDELELELRFWPGQSEPFGNEFRLCKKFNLPRNCPYIVGQSGYRTRLSPTPDHT